MTTKAAAKPATKQSKTVRAPKIVITVYAESEEQRDDFGIAATARRLTLSKFMLLAAEQLAKKKV